MNTETKSWVEVRGVRIGGHSENLCADRRYNKG
jgi:hypothetical protein